MGCCKSSKLSYKILTAKDAIQSEDSHVVVMWCVNNDGGHKWTTFAWLLLKGELGINGRINDRNGRSRYGKRKVKTNKQRIVKAHLDGSILYLNHNNKILKSDWLLTTLFQQYIGQLNSHVISRLIVMPKYTNWTVRAITCPLKWLFFLHC